MHLLRINSPSTGLAEGTADLAVIHRPLEDRRFEGAIAGLEARWCALAAADPLARRRSVRLADLSSRVLLVDQRTGTTGADLWPANARLATQESRDIDDWLTVIATGRCVGVTAQSVVDQYPRPGIVYLRVRDAEPVAVRLAWWRDDPHPATRTVLELLAEFYAHDRSSVPRTCRIHRQMRYKCAFYAFGSQSASCSIGSASSVISRPSSGTRW